MLETMWIKRSPPALLVGMYTDTAIMENNMEIPLKTRNKSTIWPSNPTTGIHPEKTTILKDIHPNVHCHNIYKSQNIEAT